MMISNYSKDLSSEHVLGRYLDSHFYEKVLPKFSRNENLSLQKKGVDVFVETPKGRMAIDEKAQSFYLGSPLPTFAFEIFRSTREELLPGWLFSDNLTDAYLLVFFNKMNGKPKRLREESEISELELLLVYKKKILEELSKMGLSRKKLVEMANTLLSLPKDTVLESPLFSCKSGIKWKLNRDFSLFYTTSLYEKPVNIVISRRILDKIFLGIFQTGECGISQIQ